MEAKELRIGNYVDFEYGEDIRTFGFLNKIEEVQELLEIEKGTFKCQPIPLTEEWLLKFGFEKAPLVDKYLKGYFTYDSKLKYFTYFTDIEDGGYENIIIQKEKLKYVHQLQNLYFALIGEELILKN